MSYLLNRGFKRGQADQTLFVEWDEKSLLVAQMYVDDIVFGSSIDALAQEFSEEMKKEFEMSMVGELNYFLGLQVKQRKDRIFISQEKSLPKNQRGPQVKHFYHHCGIWGHTRPNRFKLQALKRVDSLRDQGNSRRMPRGNQPKGENEGQLIGDFMEMLKKISLCLASFTPRFENYVSRTPPSRDLTQNTRVVWVKKGSHAWLLTMSMH